MGRNSQSQEILTQVAAMLTTALAKSGMTQRDLAARLNLSEGRVSQILSGKSNLTIQSLVKIAIILNLKLRIDFNGSE